MNKQVRVIAKDGTTQTIKRGSALFVCGQLDTSSLREISAADFVAGQWTWIACGNVSNQKVAKDGRLIDMQDERQPSETSML